MAALDDHVGWLCGPSSGRLRCTLQRAVDRRVGAHLGDACGAPGRQHSGRQDQPVSGATPTLKCVSVRHVRGEGVDLVAEVRVEFFLLLHTPAAHVGHLVLQ